MKIHPDIHKKLWLLKLQHDIDMEDLVDSIFHFVLDSEDKVTECVGNINRQAN